MYQRRTPPNQVWTQEHRVHTATSRDRAGTRSLESTEFSQPDLCLQNSCAQHHSHHPPIMDFLVKLSRRKTGFPYSLTKLHQKLQWRMLSGSLPSLGSGAPTLVKGWYQKPSAIPELAATTPRSRPLVHTRQCSLRAPYQPKYPRIICSPN